ncbi:MAG: glycosyltransferase family 4 protein [Verrucomicrobia bacterium]|nr:glycosyltransferase family 4 protein [Verrucomicrobiota bacterium]
MRIVLDLQAGQSESRFRPIGRYSLALAQAIAREAGRHEVWLVLSERFPDSIEPIRAIFTDLIPSERIRVVELPGPVAEADLANAWRMHAAELLREKFLADLRPDIVHNSTMLEGWGNEVVVSAGRLNSTVPTAATLYDLGPLLQPDTQLCNPAEKRSLLRHAQSLKRTDLLLAISESVRREATEALQISPERIVTIGAGIDQAFQGGKPARDAQAALMARYGLKRPFVLYASALESRNTVEGLIAAFALMPQDVRLAHQLAIVGGFSEDQRRLLEDTARKHGLKGDAMLCLDGIKVEDLRQLYGTCSVFVSPSFCDDSGLSVLEAMAEGAPVIGPNCKGVLEIIDRKDALFDPQQPQDMANRMAEVLSTREFRQNLKAWGFERARAVTWAAGARKALRAFEALHEKRKGKNAVVVPGSGQNKPLLAFISPLPPADTPVANCCAQILPNLARYYHIICVVDQPSVTDPWIKAEFAIRDVRWLEANAARFERILYHFSNSASCKHMFALLQQHPGVAVLHDFYLGAALMEEFSSGSFTKALYDSHGFAALEKDRVDGREASIGIFPSNGTVLRTSLGVIAHTKDVTELTRTWYGESGLPPIRQIPCSPNGQQTANHSPVNDPEAVAALYKDFIEEFYTTSPRAWEQYLVQAIACASAPAEPSDVDLENVIAALAANRGRFGLPQILIDVTVLAGYDSRTGIQRVTRGILMALITDPPPGYRVEPIRADGDLYLYARRFACKCLGLPEEDLTDDPVEAGYGDIFLGVEWIADLHPSMKPWFLKARQRGMQIVFVVHDLLSLLRPELFPPTIPPAALEWIQTVTEVADKLACVSRTVADELHAWLNSAKPQRLRPLLLGFFHHGADLHASLPSKGMPDNAQEYLAKMRSHPCFLMVGTIEPRKGHRQALDAMEQLWADGVEANLVIVGQKGWMVDDLVQRIQQHPEHNNRLFWLEGISDEMLEEVYRSSDALLAASEGEGFGLPLIEAAKHGLPIIARDIPVFREVASEHAYYFRGESTQALASALRAWLSLGDAIPSSANMPWLTWKQSSRQLLDFVLGRRWYHAWPEAGTKGTSENFSLVP